MRCQKCRSNVKEGWKFCPVCGIPLNKGSVFGNIFERMNREMSQINKEMGNMSKVFRNNQIAKKSISGSGFSIKISSVGNNEPKVFVRTFGDVKKSNIRNKIGNFQSARSALTVKNTPNQNKMIVGNAHEPAASIKKVDDELVVEIDLPGIKKINEIEMDILENSIEIRASSGGKSYFKIITKPSGSDIIEKRFENEKLILKIA